MHTFFGYKIHRVGTKIVHYTLILLFGINGAIISLLNLDIYTSFIVIVPSLVFFCFVLRFFRYPNRKPIILSQNEILSPADGQVVVIEEVEFDKFYEGKAMQISIFMTPLNVHLNWVPIDSVVEKYNYLDGKYLFAKNPKASMLNEMACYTLKTDKNQRIVVKQIAGFVARRILPFIKANSVVKQGEELGFIRFGSRVDIVIQVNSIVHVKIGEKTKGLLTHIATLPD